ncbi:MAG: class I SAM-dependent methyltransferase [Methylophilus sp.]|uniref:class I SAM-dependent methyltransferase n=1 Tax=Methylophilus sp. TaxID=29541 RepID=UPI003FA0E82F
MPPEIPSPIDLKDPATAAEWAQSALAKRPWRPEFFQAFADTILKYFPTGAVRILELGSGPGFLAEFLLQALPKSQYVALDFSAAMHALAKERVGLGSEHIHFLERDFLTPDWSQGLGVFDVIVTMQAVHELRHKTRASSLHQQVKSLLHSDGYYLLCDHHTDDGGMQNTELYMSVAEQRAALSAGGFDQITLILNKGGLALHQAHCHA